MKGQVDVRDVSLVFFTLAILVAGVWLLGLPVGAQTDEGFTNFTNVDVEDLLRLSPQSALTVTAGGTVSPQGSYQPLTAAGAVGTSSITAGSAGDVVVFVNTSSNTITFTDTGTLKLSGNAALAQYDTLTLLADGTNWVEIGQTDN